jgi:hypothetical protein
MPQHKIYFDDGKLQREITRAYEAIAACKELLRRSRPDTFLGRQRPSIGSPTTAGFDGVQQAAAEITDDPLQTRKHDPSSHDTA